jgi:hypothetical protein
MVNKFLNLHRFFIIGISFGLGLTIIGALFLNGSVGQASPQALDKFTFLPSILQGLGAVNTDYTVLAWNDLGMHCYNRDFQDLSVLPPYNTLWAQVIRRGDPPQVVTSGIRVSYSFPENTYSVGKSNFWTYAFDLFGVNLAPNIGLTGKGLAGQMDVSGDHFVAAGIPLTEYTDNDLVNPQPFQLATISVRSTATGNELLRMQVVAPVSTEMRCDECHFDGGVENISTGKIETNILTLHDRENAAEYPPGHTGNLMNRRPILCAECHASNALGLPGVNTLPSLSRAMHSQHAGIVANSTDGCYHCHPGPQTRCLRDVMEQKYSLGCTNCHGNMETVSQNPNPWLNEPRCDTCHKGFVYDQPLYRNSTGHGGIYCEGCHDSTHAIAPSRESRDGAKFLSLQGAPGPLNKCTVCHKTQPSSGGPHAGW